ncbi:IS3 family transposase [Clostridium sp. USBA 49]|uniref:IS3 family transposase n=1 Tax=Clostridium sp. USBA 49 TaxID=1881060 RepID=UPI001FA87CD0|nr:IS3 family transposase [Clostridium sp. USBA 49]
MLKILGVSRSGYNSFKKRLPSDRIKRKENLKIKIKEIYDESHQNYGAPKITEVLHQKGEKIAIKTVGNYMRELGIKAQYMKPYTVTTIDSNFSEELINILNEEFNPEEPNAV